jgi:Resolvase, N terminal domain
MQEGRLKAVRLDETSRTKLIPVEEVERYEREHLGRRGKRPQPQSSPSSNASNAPISRPITSAGKQPASSWPPRRSRQRTRSRTMTRQDKTTAMYVRSAVHSRTGDRSLAAQEQACRAYAAARGWHVGEVFADEGIPSTQRDRPAMNQLLTAVRDRVVERMLIARPDRLSRSYTDMKAIVDEREAQGVECVAVEQSSDQRAPEPAE